jgi:hypothetical protein
VLDSVSILDSDLDGEVYGFMASAVKDLLHDDYRHLPVEQVGSTEPEDH